jgi:membrane-bound serine protease (ClpP class)
MKRLYLSVIWLFLFSVVIFPSSEIILIRWEGMIHNVTSSYIEKGLDRAEKDNASLVIFELNTPGGYSDSMEKIIRKIMGSKIPVVVFIGPSGAKAASAGFFIAMSADAVVMAPGTNTGAAHPVMVPIIPTSIPSDDENEQKKKEKSQDQIMGEKVLKDSIAYMKSLVGARKRNIDLAVKAVSESDSYTAEEALKGGLIDFIANNVDEALSKLEGYTITRVNGEKIVLHLRGKQLTVIEMGWKENFLNSIANPTLIFLFLIIAAVGIYAEFTHPGAILPGTIGFISLILFFFAAQILPINVVGLLLILTAVILFILEFKVVSFGLLTVGGIVCMILGGMLLIDTPQPELRVPIIAIIPIAVAVAAIVSFLTYLVIKSLRKKVVTGTKGLIGLEATVTVPLTPEGKVFVQGEIWNATAVEKIKKDEIVIIEKVDEMKLHVKKKGTN